jgi:hypothetical protein
LSSQQLNKAAEYRVVSTVWVAGVGTSVLTTSEASQAVKDIFANTTVAATAAGSPLLLLPHQSSDPPAAATLRIYQSNWGICNNPACLCGALRTAKVPNVYDSTCVTFYECSAAAASAMLQSCPFRMIFVVRTRQCEYAFSALRCWPVNATSTML